MTPLLALSLLFIVTALPAQTPNPTALSDEAREAIPVPRDSYRVGLSLLTGDLEPDDRVVTLTLPRLLYQEIELLSERDLLPEEIAASRDRRLQIAVEGVASELAAAVAARDALLFATASTPENRAAAEDRVAAARTLFTELTTLDTALIDVPATLPIEFHEDHALGEFFSVEVDGAGSVPVDALAELSAREDLDLLVWGEVEDIEGYLAIDLYAYYADLRRSRPAGATIVRSTDASLEAGFVADELAAEVLGRPFASVAVQASEPDAAITVDGQLAGYGSVVVRFLRQGEVLIEAEAEGFVPASTRVGLVADERTDLALELEPLGPRLVEIRSSPEGADVYANSVWIGRTPLEYSFPPDPTIVRVATEGYLESRFVVDSASAAVVSRALLPASIDWTEELRRERDDFYQALTWLVVSIPVTIILRGGYQGVLAAFPADDPGALSDEELQRLARRGNILYWSSIGSLLANAGLAVNLGFAIADYVEVGEGSHNQ